MARRVLVVLLLPLVLASPAAAARLVGAAADRLVTAQGLMGGTPRLPARTTRSRGRARRPRRRPDRQEAPVAANPSAPVTIGQLDAELVRALGLLPAARRSAPARALPASRPARFRHRGRRAAARPARRPPRRAGRASSCSRPTRPRAPRRPTPPRASSPSAAGRRTGSAKLAAAFQLPVVTGLSSACSRPPSSSSATPTSGAARASGRRTRSPPAEVPGGFDCSGFVWRVYKLQAYAGADALAATLRGRTTYAMSGEVRAGAADPARTAPARRRHLLRRERPPSRSRPRSTTRASTSATAGSSTRPSKGVELALLSRLVREALRVGPPAARRGRSLLASSRAGDAGVRQ